MLVQLDTFKHGNLALRLAQLLFSVIVLSTVGAGFKGKDFTVQDGKDDYTLSVLFTSHTSQYVLLMAYTAMLFILFYLGLVATPMNTTATFRPRRIAEFMADGVLAVLYLIGGIALSASSIVQHCSTFNDYAELALGMNKALRCGHLTTCCVFLFLAFVAHLCSMALVFFVAAKGSFGNLMRSDTEMQDQLTPQQEDNPPVRVPMPYNEEVTPKQFHQDP